MAVNDAVTSDEAFERRLEVGTLTIVLLERVTREESSGSVTLIPHDTGSKGLEFLWGGESCSITPIEPLNPTDSREAQMLHESPVYPKPRLSHIFEMFSFEVVRDALEREINLRR